MATRPSNVDGSTTCATRGQAEACVQACLLCWCLQVGAHEHCCCCCQYFTALVDSRRLIHSLAHPLVQQHDRCGVLDGIMGSTSRRHTAAARRTWAAPLALYGCSQVARCQYCQAPRTTTTISKAGVRHGVKALSWRHISSQAQCREVVVETMAKQQVIDQQQPHASQHLLQRSPTRAQ